MKVAIIGYGKMGKLIASLALERGHEIVAKYNSEYPFSKDSLTKCDVAIEFTSPELAVNHIETCLMNNLSVVSGSTGWYAEKERLETLCNEQDGSFLYASNFSLGVNILFSINERLAEILNQYPDYNPEIKEIHHTEKKDSPSGTAISLAEGLLKYYPSKEKWVNRKSNSDRELSIISERKENVPGTHQITYHSEIDSLSLAHVAHSRKGFALGAIIAAEWLHGKKGTYTMNDVLKL